MSFDQTQRRCPHCGQLRRFVRPPMFTIIDLLLVAITFGLWLLFMAIKAITYSTACPWRCALCGTAHGSR